MAVSTPPRSSKGTEFARANTCWRNSCTSSRRNCGKLATFSLSWQSRSAWNSCSCNSVYCRMNTFFAGLSVWDCLFHLGRHADGYEVVLASVVGSSQHKPSSACAARYSSWRLLWNWFKLSRWHTLKTRKVQALVSKPTNFQHCSRYSMRALAMHQIPSDCKRPSAIMASTIFLNSSHVVQKMRGAYVLKFREMYPSISLA